MSSISIQPVTSAEISVLAAISRSIFYQSFAEQNNDEDMNSYMDRAFSEARLLTELANPQSAFYFARREDDVIGYLKLNWGTAQTEFQEQNGLEIERIYLKPAAQGTGAAQQLMLFSIDFAESKKADFIWLGVWEKNPKAIRFYEKHGFSTIGSHQFVLGTDVQTDLLMRKELSNG